MTALTMPASTPGIRPRISGLTAESVFVGRSLRHSLRDGESLLMAIMLPVMLMLLFTFVFGGAPNDVAHGQKSFDRVRSWAWTSRPMTASHRAPSALEPCPAPPTGPAPLLPLPICASRISVFCVFLAFGRRRRSLALS